MQQMVEAALFLNFTAPAGFSCDWPVGSGLRRPRCAILICSAKRLMFKVIRVDYTTKV